MFIVDSQVHIWALDSPERPWAYKAKPHRETPFSKDDALREANDAGVDRVVIIPPWWEGERNDLALDAARSYPDRFAVMGLFDADAPDARSNLKAWRSEPGMLGFRFSSRDPKYKSALPSGRIDWVWGQAEESAVPVMMSVDPDQLHYVGEIAERHPNLRVAIDHFARAFGKKDAEAFPNMEGLLALAKHANICVKASGIPQYASGQYPYPQMWPYIRRVYDAFGPRRIFWGSDMTKLPCTYRQAVTLFTEEIPWMTEDDRQWIMGRALCDWLRWPLP